VSLKDRLVRDIREDGPMTVADYMTRCLHDPLDGYYATRPALGETGDFITAPLISQMFGEIVGAWTHEIWVRLGAPKRFRLIELGPGTGVLMADILRVSRLDAAFAAACEPWLVERGAPLRALQAAAVPGARWADRLDAVPGEAPTVIVANEFLDCLPIRQAIARAGGWRERRVGLADDGSLAFVEGPTWGDFQPPRAARPDEVWEWSPKLAQFGAEVGARLVADAGAALFIDYGRDAPGPGDTLQAVRGHEKELALANPGVADLTAHVDFPAFAAAARGAGATVSPIESQGAFLTRLGIAHRAAALERASPERAGAIDRQLDRLVSPDGMGALFKVVAMTSPGLAAP
jgi:NADH dehydrogenase [ubiquinone] 1 alpha subcomplex assembly factor 7